MPFVTGQMQRCPTVIVFVDVIDVILRGVVRRWRPGPLDFRNVPTHGRNVQAYVAPVAMKQFDRGNMVSSRSVKHRRRAVFVSIVEDGPVRLGHQILNDIVVAFLRCVQKRCHSAVILLGCPIISLL